MNIIVDNIEVMKRVPGGDLGEPFRIVNSVPINTPFIAGSGNSMAKPIPPLRVRYPVMTGTERA